MENNILNKELKHFELIVSIILVILTIVSLSIDVIVNTYNIYGMCQENIYHAETLNNFIQSKGFNIVIWVDNLLIYLVSIFYIVSAISSKKNVFIKISFAAFSVVTTIIINSFIVNFIAGIFGIF